MIKLTKKSQLKDINKIENILFYYYKIIKKNASEKKRNFK